MVVAGAVGSACRAMLRCGAAAVLWARSGARASCSVLYARALAKLIVGIV